MKTQGGSVFKGLEPVEFLGGSKVDLDRRFTGLTLQ